MNGFRKELEHNILRFWEEKMVDEEHGGFYGRIDGKNRLLPGANKGAVMNTRVLWTFSAAYRVLNEKRYRDMAKRAFQYIKNHFVDPLYGGIFWEVDHLGEPVNTKKQIYAQGFALYGFSEYYRATGEQEALDFAISLFDSIETCKDVRLGGYWEAFTKDWQPIADMRLSEKDENEAKTMNTHLHILEAYTNLIRVWRDERVLASQHNLVRVFLDHIVNPETGHLQLFFDGEWNTKGTVVSYGHDIEAAWLLWEAVTVLGDVKLQDEVRPVVRKIAEAAAEGILPDGSMAYELKNGHLDHEKHWWVQAEAVVGYQYMAKIFNDDAFKRKAEALWSYIQQYTVDKENGEWYWSRLENGLVNDGEDKAGFWKCPYHNGRMCLEMIEF
ncbi:mannobiose 2-epimerase [Sphingobacterium allocomposti]|uniref:Cellobiose 2-epimerase n=1 Tax=Sphingobacterium allocomposti TaxID=415956 RepID=A0A5S5CUQ8_9SPHI|nr:AGE family epimerase/isomerase [Sphingobacterium composti Yoo et al. 2007 non Ten et al. 2007]TYP87345.1 mannobiose 2-epimerase [Sphingobacterium composti Yoo et al. 2007 non Ten et al. 2007]